MRSLKIIGAALLAACLLAGHAHGQELATRYADNYNQAKRNLDIAAGKVYRARGDSCESFTTPKGCSWALGAAQAELTIAAAEYTAWRTAEILAEKAKQQAQPSK